MIDVKLRHIDFEKDMDTLFVTMTDPLQQRLISHKLTINNKIDFQNWFMNHLKTYYHEFYILERNDGKFIGFIYSHDYFVNDRHLKFTLSIDPCFQNKGYGPIAALKFMDLMFMNYPIRKIYVTVFGYNATSLRNNLKAGFYVEACLKEYRYFNGEYHDLYFLSMSKEKFYESSSMIIKMISRKPDIGHLRCSNADKKS